MFRPKRSPVSKPRVTWHGRYVGQELSLNVLRMALAESGHLDWGPDPLVFLIILFSRSLVLFSETLVPVRALL